MSSVRKNVIVVPESFDDQRISFRCFSLLLPAPHNPLSRPFQSRDKGLLRYRLHPSRRARLLGRPIKHRGRVLRGTSSVVARLFPLGSLLCKRRIEHPCAGRSPATPSVTLFRDTLWNRNNSTARSEWPENAGWETKLRRNFFLINKLCVATNDTSSITGVSTVRFTFEHTGNLRATIGQIRAPRNNVWSATRDNVNALQNQ